MIRLFQTWRAARRKKMCDLVAQIWAECEAELLAEIEAAKREKPDYTMDFSKAVPVTEFTLSRPEEESDA